MIAELALSMMLMVVEPPPTMDYIGEYTVTAYSYEEGGGENYYTAGGYTPVPYYTVAAPHDIPMGTVLYIEDIGEVQVQDRGAFPNYIIDIHVGHDDPNSWDMRNYKVYIVRKE